MGQASRNCKHRADERSGCVRAVVDRAHADVGSLKRRDENTMPADVYREQITRYAQLLNLDTERSPDHPELVQLSVTRLPPPILVYFTERENPLLSKGMQVMVAQFVIHLALTQTMVRGFIEKSRDIATCWGVAVEVRDAPESMTNLEPLAEYHADLRVTLPARSVDLETFAWLVNQMVCAYVDLMGTPVKPRA